jgi:hypothetical protein
VAGVSLLVDLPFPAFPDNMGHWAEALLPVYNVLEQGPWREALPAGSSASGTIDTLIFVNLRNEDLLVGPSCNVAARRLGLCRSLSGLQQDPVCPALSFALGKAVRRFCCQEGVHGKRRLACAVSGQRTAGNAWPSRSLARLDLSPKAGTHPRHCRVHGMMQIRLFHAVSIDCPSTRGAEKLPHISAGGQSLGLVVTGAGLGVGDAAAVPGAWSGPRQ